MNFSNSNQSSNEDPQRNSDSEYFIPCKRAQFDVEEMSEDDS